MSAETIPAEVLYLIRKGGLFYRPNSQGYTAHTFDAGRYTLAEAEAITHPNGPDGPRDGLSYVPAPADRSTRPAEPAAPVAEAGDGDVAASLAHLNIGYLYGIADALEHTDFTRAGDIRQCLLQVVKGLSASAATLEAERARADAAEASLQKVLLEEQEHIKTMWEQKFRADAAEQRAADALARAEKAAEDERDRLYAKIMEKGPFMRPEHDQGIRQFLQLERATMPADRAAARASREAQPATDGGDNG